VFRGTSEIERQTHEWNSQFRVAVGWYTHTHSTEKRRRPTSGNRQPDGLSTSGTVGHYQRTLCCNRPETL
jgi:hypothetical protein